MSWERVIELGIKRGFGFFIIRDRKLNLNKNVLVRVKNILGEILVLDVLWIGFK